MSFRKKVAILGFILMGVAMTSIGMGCATAYRQSLGGVLLKVHSQIYVTDFNTAWQSVLDALKSNVIEVSNREGGFIQTKWTDNTAEKNFVDTFGPQNTYLKAQYRFRITVAKGIYDGEQAIKVTVQKEQLVQKDVLDGWRPVETDLIEEKTLLYRIGRLIYIRMKLAAMEEERIQRELEQSEESSNRSNHSNNKDEKDLDF
jgi:hypothetical protein